MRPKLDFSGLRKQIAPLVAEALEPIAANAAHNAGKNIISEIRRILGPYPHRTGRFYPSRKTKARLRITGLYGNKRVARVMLHRASAPGEAPAPDTEDYRNSFYYTVTKIAVGFEVVVGSSLWLMFGRRLEFGGLDSRGVYIAPRPHIRVAFQRLGKFKFLGQADSFE